VHCDYEKVVVQISGLISKVGRRSCEYYLTLNICVVAKKR